MGLPTARADRPGGSLMKGANPHMGVFDNIKNKAEEVVGQDKVAKAEDLAAQHSDKVEQYSDQGLDFAADRADSATGGKYTDHIQGARDNVDARIGNEGDVVDPAPKADPQP